MAGVRPAAKRKAAKPAAAQDGAATPPAGLASPPSPTPPPSRPAPIAVLRVVGPVQGRRRAGRAFVAEEVVIPLADLSEADVVAIQADPMLACALDAVDPADLQT